MIYGPCITLHFQNPASISRGGAGCQHTLCLLHCVPSTARLMWLNMALESTVKRAGLRWREWIGCLDGCGARNINLNIYATILYQWDGCAKANEECWPMLQIVGPLINNRPVRRTRNGGFILQLWLERKGNNSPSVFLTIHSMINSWLIQECSSTAKQDSISASHLVNLQHSLSL